jgi:hypothetical protein
MHEAEKAEVCFARSFKEVSLIKEVREMNRIIIRANGMVRRLRSKKQLMERRIMWVFCEFMRNYVKAQTNAGYVFMSARRKSSILPKD